MNRFSQTIVPYKILKSQKNTLNLNKMSTIVSDLSEVSSEELCLPQADLDLKKQNFALRGAESKSHVMF